MTLDSNAGLKLKSFAIESRVLGFVLIVGLDPDSLKFTVGSAWPKPLRTDGSPLAVPLALVGSPLDVPLALVGSPLDVTLDLVGSPLDVTLDLVGSPLPIAGPAEMFPLTSCGRSADTLLAEESSLASPPLCELDP